MADAVDMETKQKAGVGGAVAVVVALTGAYTAFHGTHTEATNTAVTRNDTPLVINRPHDAKGSPLPVTVIPPSKNGGPPIVIVGAEPPSCFAGGTRARALPDRACTPGAIRGATVATICTPGTAADARSVPESVKKKVREEYGYTPADFKGEIDHLISLQLGGSNDIKNLWPEEGQVPNEKDAIENRLHAWVCKTRSSTRLRAAQKAISKNWTTADAIIH